MEALYRKYRPSTFSDVVGQEHIERTLKNAIEQGKVSHAYLFCGPRGTGKTTTARILAKALLCENGPTTEPDGTCEECQAIAQGNHPDVYELDAASRTGVENVREEIISRVSYAPTRGKWKVYIIDEVHMLSTAAFNALLKTIEEPPGHVAFILCTTDPQKVPETIQSRCQRFDFHRISIESIVSRLGTVCVEEGVEFEPEALELIAHRAEGGMRNALTTLEQLIAFDAGKVTLVGAQNLLGTLDDTDLSEIIEAIGKRDAVACFNWLANYVETGADLAQFVQDLAEYTRTMYLLSLAGLDVELEVSSATRKAMEGQLPLFGTDRLARMLEVLGDVSRELRTASNPRLAFEIALTRLVRPESDLTLQALAERVEELERKLAGMAASGVPAQTSAAAVQGSVPAVGVASAPTAQVAQGVSAAATAAPAVQAAQGARTPMPSSPFASEQGRPAVAATPPSASQNAQPAARSASMPNPSAPSSSADASTSANAYAAPANQAAAPDPAASAPQPARRTAVAESGSVAAAPESAAAVPAPAPQGAVAMTASVDVSNPAALQRFWRSVTSTLRKVNPARGVLFMNAKIFADPSGKGIVIQFGKDGGFAYNAAQKTEVQELLAKTIAQVAGGTVPYRLSIEGGAGSSAPVAPARPAASSQPARSLVPPSAPKQPEFQTQPNPQFSAPASVGAAPVSQDAKPAFTPASAPDSSPVASTASTPAPSAPVVPSAQPPAQDFDQVPYEEVPLDVYGESVPADLGDTGSYDAVPSQVAAPASAPSPKAAPTAGQYAQSHPQAATAPVRPAQSQPEPAPTAAQPAQPRPQAAASYQPATAPSAPVGAGRASGSSPESRPTATQGNPASTAAQANPQTGESEAEQIKSILTNSFGPGVKFEELPE